MRRWLLAAALMAACAWPATAWRGVGGPGGRFGEPVRVQRPPPSGVGSLSGVQTNPCAFYVSATAGARWSRAWCGVQQTPQLSRSRCV